MADALPKTGPGLSARLFLRKSPASRKRPALSILIYTGIPCGCPPGESLRAWGPPRFSVQVVATGTRAIAGADGVLASLRLRKPEHVTLLQELRRNPEGPDVLFGSRSL